LTGHPEQRVSGLRIIAGAFRGRRLRVPPGARVRPTADRVREALFNILGDAALGTRVLDLYAGTGALGLEALSRGAREVTFVESDAGVLRVLRANVEQLDAEHRCRIVPGDVPSLLGRGALGGPFDLVLADPPYGGPGTRAVLDGVARGATLAPGGRLVLERDSRDTPRAGTAQGLDLVRTARYGDTSLDFYLLRGPADGP